MKSVLRLEEAAILALTIYLNSYLPFSAWVFWALFLSPDLGMLGYLINAKTGALTYNLLHHKGVAIIFYLIGFYLFIPELTLVGLVLLGHSSFDRIFGYGLKYADHFKHTHLGIIGKTSG